MDLPKSKVEILLHVFSKSMNSLLLTTLYHISSRPLITWKERRRNGFKKQRYKIFKKKLRRVEKWKDDKLFYLVEKKIEKIENRVCINLLSCPY